MSHRQNRVTWAWTYQFWFFQLDLYTWVRRFGKLLKHFNLHSFLFVVCNHRPIRNMLEDLLVTRTTLAWMRWRRRKKTRGRHMTCCVWLPSYWSWRRCTFECPSLVGQVDNQPLYPHLLPKTAQEIHLRWHATDISCRFHTACVCSSAVHCVPEFHFWQRNYDPRKYCWGLEGRESFEPYW